MTGIRRGLSCVGLTAAVIVGSSIPASATFAEPSPRTPPCWHRHRRRPAGLIVDDSCTTTTTTVKRTVDTDPAPAPDHDDYSSTTTQATSSTNAQRHHDQSVAGPGPNETTTTTVTKNTELYVTLRWTASTVARRQRLPGHRPPRPTGRSPADGHHQRHDVGHAARGRRHARLRSRACRSRP